MCQPQDRRCRGRRGIIWLAALVLLGTGHAAQDGGVRSFSIHDTRSAAAARDAAEAHIGAGRWAEAIEVLQALIEEHRGEVLRVSSGTSEQVGDADGALYRGAPRSAAARLASLPRLARDLYQERFGTAAGRALLRARASGDRSQLVEVARRWPITEEALAALWALGDLAWEEGSPDAARRAWGRALVRILDGEPGSSPGGAGDPTGRTGDAAAAWERALDACERRDPPAARGARRRLALVTAPRQGADAAPAHFRLAGSGEGAAPAPGRESGGWPEPFTLPAHPYRNTSGGPLYPVLAEDLILISTSLQLIALDALSGRVRWSGDLVPGWDDLPSERLKEFFDGIDHSSALIAAAAGSGVAVAALQIPVSAVRKSTYGDSDIVRVLPDRRLFAYDLETGRLLWDHRPPPLWDGEGGRFEERMRVCGPPVIAEDRVLVPMCRYQGRIDFHIGCFDLTSGTRLWSAPLITGQRELNMFGRPTQEFSAPPVRVEDGLVCVLTQLGSIAAVDLFSGELLWEFLYDQMPLPQTRGWTPVWRREVWLNAPPVAAGGVLLATPVDSRDLVAVDLASGRPLWALDHGDLETMALAGADTRSSRQVLDVLLGADGDTVYFGGRIVTALAADAGPGETGARGLANGPPTAARWTIEDAGGSREHPRALLARDTVLIPSYDRRLEVDRRTGRRRDHPMAWRDGPGGNVLLASGALYHLTPRQLSATFEWDALLQRAEADLAARPDAPSAARALAGLYAERGRSLWRDGRAGEAGAWLQRAHETLVPFARAEDRIVETGLLREMHLVLRIQSRVRDELGDGAGARALLAEARLLATGPELRRESPELLRDTIVEQWLGLDVSAATGVRMALLDDLERGVAELDLLCLLADPAPAEPGGRSEGIMDATGEATGSIRSFHLHPLRPDLGRGSASRSPTSQGPARSIGAAEAVGREVTLRTQAWVLVERSDLAAREGLRARLFADLHSLLAKHASVAPGERGETTLGEWAAARIGDELAGGREEAHAPYQELARGLLAAARLSRRTADLERIQRLYPHTRAAEEAQRELLRWALESGDLAEAASVILGELPREFSPASPSALQLEQFRALAGLFGEAGNSSLADGWLAALDGRHPTEAAPPPAPGPGTLGTQLDPLGRMKEHWSDLGPLRAGAGREGADAGGRLLAGDYRLAVWGADGRVRWEFDLQIRERPASWNGRVASAQGRLHVATTSRLLCFDIASGDLLWTRDLPGYVSGLGLASGVLVSGVRGQETGTTFFAFDALAGLPLWRRVLPTAGLAAEPICGPRHALVLPRNPGREALALDLFTGGIRARIGTGTVLGSTRAAAWVQGHRLILPNFLEGSRSERNHISAFDLDTGQLAWEVRFGDDGEGRELHAVLSQGGNHFLLLRSRANRGESRTSSGGAGVAGSGVLLQLDTTIGATARVGHLEIGDDEQPMGVAKGRRVELEAPFLFLRSMPPGRPELRLRAVHLPYGERWSALVPLRAGELYTRSMPLPALFENAVALAWTEWPQHALRPQAHTFLTLLDRSTGRHLAQRELAPDMGTSEHLDLGPAGNHLLVLGRRGMEVMR